MISTFLVLFEVALESPPVGCLLCQVAVASVELELQ